jgi:hypothetical protein
MNNYTIAIIAIVSSGIAGFISGSLRGYTKGKEDGEGKLKGELQITEENSRQPKVYTFLRCVSSECLEAGGKLYQLTLNHKVRHYYLDFAIPESIKSGDKFVVYFRNGKYEFVKYAEDFLGEQILGEA